MTPFSATGGRCSSRVLLHSSLQSFAYVLPGFNMPFLAVTTAKVLENEFEALLRTVDVAEELITILRVRNVVDRATF